MVMFHCTHTAAGVRFERVMSTFFCLCVDVTTGSLGDMSALGVTESFKVKCHVLLYAAEAAEMIVRVDNILKAAPR